MTKECDNNSETSSQDSVSQCSGLSMSTDDSDYTELVNQGKEDHPLVKYTRMVKDKKAELEYHYNPNVPKNKNKNMVPLWTAAKKTVDGAMKDLQAIIGDQRKKGVKGEEILKLELVEKELQVVSMQFSMHLSSSTPTNAANVNIDGLNKREMQKILEKFNRKAEKGIEDYEDHDPELRKQFKLDMAMQMSLMENTKESRKKFTSYFVSSCPDRKKCSQCRESEVDGSLSVPCSLDFRDQELVRKANNMGLNNEFFYVGSSIKYALLTCVRSKTPELRSLGITTYRTITNYDDSVEELQDVKKLIASKPLDFTFIVLDNNKKRADLIKMLSQLLDDAAVAILKTTHDYEIEDFSKRCLNYHVLTDVDEEHTYIWSTFYDQDGMFGFITWFAKFVVLSLLEETLPTLAAEMFIFNLEVLPVLINMVDYKRNEYPCFEVLIYNFSKVFKHIWTCKMDDWGNSRVDTISIVKSKKNKNRLTVNNALLPRNTEEYCGVCKKKNPKSQQLYPLCYQGVTLSESSFPREVARMERDDSECEKEITLTEMMKCKRSTVVVCSLKCVMEAMSMMNPTVHLLTKAMPIFLANKHVCTTWLAKVGIRQQLIDEWPLIRTDFDRINSLKVCIRYLLDKVHKELKYFNLRCMVSKTYPFDGLNEVAGSCGKFLEFDHKLKAQKDAEKEKEQQDKWRANYERDLLKGEARKPIDAKSTLSNISLGKTLPTSKDDIMSEDLPKNIEDYVGNLMLHSKKSDTSCTHAQLWGGWAKFHPLNQMFKYVGGQDDKGFSKSCINFQLKIETCDHIDLKLMKAEERKSLTESLSAFNDKTVHLFPLYLMEQQIDYLRDHCYKVALSGPANHDDVAMEKMFSCIPAALGLWENFKRGIIVCKSPKTYFAFIPHDTVEFFKFLAFGHEIIRVRPLVTVFKNIFMDRIFDEVENHDKINKVLTDAGFPEISKNHIMYSIYAFGVLQMIADREKLQEIIKGNGLGERKFEALMTSRLKEGELKDALYNSNDNLLTRWTPRHTIGCSHDMVWSGMMFFSEVEETVVSNYSVTCWAYRCECVTNQAGVNGGDDVVIPKEFWRNLPQRLDVLMLPGDNIVKEDEDKRAVLVFEPGAIQKDVIEFIRDKRNFAVSCLSTGQSTDIKYLIRYSYSEVDKKMYGKIFNGRIPAIETRMAEMRTRGCKNINKILTDSVAFNNKVPRSERELKESHRIVWSGEMMSLFIGPHAVGHTASERLLEFTVMDQREAKTSMEEEDIGSIRNGPFQPCSGYFSYSSYVAVSSPSVPAAVEPIFNKARESGVALVALDVEKKVIENIIGSYKKCHTLQITIHDDNYLTKEIRDHGKKLLGIFLQHNESVMDIFKKTPAEAVKRFVIVKYDTKDNISVLCIPKEKDKMEQIWKNFMKTSQFSTHEKMLKKLRKQDKIETASFNVKTVIDANASGCKVESVEVTPVEAPKKGKNKKKKEAASSKETDKTVDDITNNFKKMFPKVPAKVEPEKEKEAGAAGGGDKEQTVSKKKMCWNCHATEADGVKLLKCQRCKKARYCGRKCQEDDWDRHSKTCEVAEKKEKKKKKEEQELD